MQKYIKFIFSAYLFFLINSCGYSQDFVEIQNKLSEKFESLYLDDTDSSHIILNNKILKEFKNALQQENSFKCDFGKLTKISKLVSDDGKLKIFTWHIQFSDGNFKYFGFIQYQNKKNKLIIELTDQSEKMTNPEQLTLNAENWYGALYYKIISKKIKKQTYYTLLGWDGNNNYSNKKLIDVLTVSSDGFIQFGAPIFEYQTQIKNRIIFEYGEQVSMVLRYDTDYKMIIWDHLAPSQKQFAGQFQFYGPDFSYDALVFKKGFWNFLEKVTPLNKEDNSSQKQYKYGY